MARHPRVVEANGIYHVFARGNNRQRIFWDDRDCRSALAILAQTATRHEWRVYAYCLMPNHVHLLVRVPHANLSAGMQYLNGGYSRRTNIRYGRARHLFQNRFGDIHVETDEQLLVALRYVVLNPVAAHLCRRPEDWRWSSYRATAGLAPAPMFLAVRETLEFFAPRREIAQLAYVAFVGDEP